MMAAQDNKIPRGKLRCVYRQGITMARGCWCKSSSVCSNNQHREGIERQPSLAVYTVVESETESSDGSSAGSIVKEQMMLSVATITFQLDHYLSTGIESILYTPLNLRSSPRRCWSKLNHFWRSKGRMTLACSSQTPATCNIRTLLLVSLYHFDWPETKRQHLAMVWGLNQRLWRSHRTRSQTWYIEAQEAENL